jgi:hypothetical protein
MVKPYPAISILLLTKCPVHPTDFYYRKKDEKGQGFEKCSILAKVKEGENFKLDLGKNFTQESGLPFVTINYAQSLDGSITLRPGYPLSISCAESLVLTHKSSGHAGCDPRGFLYDRRFVRYLREQGDTIEVPVPER